MSGQAHRVPVNIMMLGVGNGFSGTIYNNNALLAAGDSYCLIDCGVTAWLSLKQAGFDYGDIAGIFLTHLHFDHCGGLQEAAMHGAYVARRRLKLWVPEPLAPQLWEHGLKAGLDNPDDGLERLEHYFDVQVIGERQRFWFGAPGSSVEGYWLQTQHVPRRFSCSLVLNDLLFYSSDMVADRKLIERLYDEEVRVFYHDAQFDNSPVHASVKELLTYPADIRQHMYLMHYVRKPDDWSDDDLGGMSLLLQHEWKEWR